MPILTRKKEIQIRKQLNGWSADSSADVYNKRHIKEVADRLMKADMEAQAAQLKQREPGGEKG